MNPKHAKNFEALRATFEGQEAIYVEHGALRVRVSNIRVRGGFGIRATAEEIVSPGLGVGNLARLRPVGTSVLRWDFGAGYLTRFSAHSWQTGYGGWSLYFAPETVRAVVDFAARLPDNADPNKAYQELGSLLLDLNEFEPSQPVFEDAVEPESDKFRMSELPAMNADASSGWVLCPYCDMRFKLSDSRRWDGERHTTCGQKLIIQAA